MIFIFKMFFQNNRQQSRVLKMGSPDLERLLLQVAKQEQDYKKLLLSYVSCSQIWLNLLWMVARVATPQKRGKKNPGQYFYF